jgi:hypothetical protein
LQGKQARVKNADFASSVLQSCNVKTQLCVTRPQCVNSYHQVAEIINIPHMQPYIADSPQQCHSSKCVIFQERLLKVLKCYNFLSATTTQLLSSGELCKLLYLLKVHLQNVSFYTNNSKMPNFEF